MSQPGIGRLMLLLAFLAGVYASAYGSSYWDTFLERPDKDALVVLRNSVSASAQHCSWGNPGNTDIAPTEKQDAQLFKLIGNGNESAFRAVLLVAKCLDGGELEDFYRSAGMFSEAQPRAFLRIMKENAIPDSQLRDFLIMLPLETVDDFDRKIRMVENRILLLKRVNDRTLQEVRNRGLSILEKEKKILLLRPVAPSN